jgi:hypothetical protein
VSNRDVSVRTGDVWSIVILEATLAFSLPCWALSAEGAWPTDRPFRFVLAVVASATAALVFCHVLPGICARSTRGLQLGTVNKLVRWPVILWLSGGAVISLSAMSRRCGSMAMLGRVEDWPWRFVALGIAAAFAVIATALAWTGIARPKIALLCRVGVVLSIGLFAIQLPGLWLNGSRLSFDAELNHPLRVFEGILLASAPAAILAARIGRMEVGTLRIWWRGIVGLWAPMVTSVTLFSWAKMGGARLHWRPSLPIGFEFAFAGSARMVYFRMLYFVAGLTMLGPCLVCATWLRDLGWKSKFAAALAGGLSGILMLIELPTWLMEPYFRPWCWSIIGGSGVLGFICLVMKRARRT